MNHSISAAVELVIAQRDREKRLRLLAGEGWASLFYADAALVPGATLPPSCGL